MNQIQLFETLWGSAVADAIGNPLEFQYLVTNEAFLNSANAAVLRISDDTQMTLFIYEALHMGYTASEAVRRWYKTQGQRAPVMAAKGLMAFKELYSQESPGSTCMTSASALARGQTVDNNSKGNGTVMRATPFSVMAHLHGWSDETAYLMAKNDALTTHQHPYAWQSSVLLTGILLRMFRGEPLKVALLNAANALPSCQAVASLVGGMCFKDNYETMRSKRCGWVAEEALALAVGANLHNTGYLTVVRAACQGVACDSDTVAGIAGSIAAAGGAVIPNSLKDALNAKKAIEYIIGLTAPV